MFVSDLPLCAIRLVLVSVLELGSDIDKSVGIVAESFGLVKAKLAEAKIIIKVNFSDGNSQASCNDRVVASQNCTPIGKTRF